MSENETAAKYFKHPGWKLAAVFIQYVLGPALVAVITSMSVYVMQIKGQVKNDVRETMDVREVVADFVTPEPPRVRPALPSFVMPNVETTNQDQDQDQQISEPPPALIKLWKNAKGDKKAVPIELLLEEYTAQRQQQQQQQQE